LQPLRVLLVAVLIGVTVVSLSEGLSPVSGQTSTALITNGGFEDGLSGWNVNGGVQVVRAYLSSGAEPGAYSPGPYLAVLGYRYTKGELSQQFTIPQGASAELSLWYVVYPDEGPLLTVALLAQNGTMINRWVIDAYINWQELYYVIDSSYSGQLLTLVLISYPTYSRPFARTLHPTSYSSVYVGNVSVTSSIPVPEFPNSLVVLASLVVSLAILSRKRTNRIKWSTGTTDA